MAVKRIMTIERQRINEKLRELIGTLSIPKIMNECVWIGDKRHKTIYVNPVFEKLSGYSAEECMGKECGFFFDEEGKNTIDRHHELRIRGIASQYEATMVSKTGEKIPMLISGAPSEDGGTIGIFTNLTEIKKLSSHKRLTQQIIKNSGEGLIITDKKGEIKLWNRGASKIFGYAKHEMLGKNIKIISADNKAEEEKNKELLHSLETKSFINNHEVIRYTKDNEEIHVSLTIKKVTSDKSRTTIGYIFIYQDISYKKRTDQELQKRFEAMQNAYKELGIQKRQMDYFNEIAEMATTEESLENLEKLIISAIYMLTKCDGAVLRIYEKDKDILTLTQCLGLNNSWWTKSKINFKDSLAEESFEKKRPIIIDDIQNSTKHHSTSLIKKHKFQTLILIPLYLDKKMLGTISLYATNPEKFRFIETDFLSKFGQITSLALNAKFPANP